MMFSLVVLSGCVPVTDTIDRDPSDDTDIVTDTDTGPDTGPDTAVDTDVEPVIATENLVLTVHPEVGTLLVAQWEQLVAGDTWLSWDVDGEAFSSPVRTRKPGPVTEVVLGLPAETKVTVTLNAGDVPLTATGTTDPLPRGLVGPTLTIWDPIAADPAPFLLTSVDMGPNNFFGPCWVVMLDRSGRIVWYREVKQRRLTMFPRVARDGSHIAWDATVYYVPAGVHGSITRATLSLGQELETTVDGIGLTWDEHEDGSFLFDHAETAYDYHLERQYPDGTRERVWSCAEWMAAFSTAYWACAPNTARWDPTTNVVVWSMFQTSTVVGIDLGTGEMLWELGEYPGGLSFDPDGIRLELQHYPNWTPDGTLLLTTHVPGEPGVQTVRELDMGAGVARQVWSYTAPVGYYGDYAGEATRLPNGNTLVNFGTDGVVHEITTAEAAVVWEIDWADHLVGHLTPVDDLYALDAGW